MDLSNGKAAHDCMHIAWLSSIRLHIKLLRCPHLVVWGELCILVHPSPAHLPRWSHTPNRLVRDDRILWTYCSIYPTYDNDDHSDCCCCTWVITVQHPLDQGTKDHLPLARQ